jgi:hypothetical protein
VDGVFAHNGLLNACGSEKGRNTAEPMDGSAPCQALPIFIPGFGINFQMDALAVAERYGLTSV